MAVSELTEGSWANRIEGLKLTKPTLVISIYMFCKNPNMISYSSRTIWFDIMDEKLLTAADETSCTACLTLYY